MTLDVYVCGWWQDRISCAKIVVEPMTTELRRSVVKGMIGTRIQREWIPAGESRVVIVPVRRI